MTARLRSGVARLIAGWAVLALTAGTVPTSQAQEPPETKGLALLEANCAICHAIGRTGESKFVKAPPMRVIAHKYRPENLAEALAEGITVGHPAMPEFVFEPAEIEAIIAYLNTLRRAR